MGDKKKAIKYYKMGLEKQSSNEKDHDIANRHRALHNLGCAHHDLGDYQLSDFLCCMYIAHLMWFGGDRNAKQCFDALPVDHIQKTNLVFDFYENCSLNVYTINQSLPSL